MTKRQCNVEIAKFIASLLIVVQHNETAGIPAFFRGGWIYVEFFLMITGYYTAKHFDANIQQNNIKGSIEYTIKKFIGFIPYTIMVTVVGYLTQGIFNMATDNWTVKDFICGLATDFVFDVFLINEPMYVPLIVPIWYLSTMLFVFPMFSCFVQIKNRYWIMVISFVYTKLYYCQFGINGSFGFPQNIFRVLAGLCLGAFIYEFSYAFSLYIGKINSIGLTILEIMTYVFVFVSTIFDKQTFRLDIFCFAVCLIIMLTDLSCTRKINGHIFLYCGRLSVPLFITHWYVGMLIKFFGEIFLWNNIIKGSIYYVGSVLFSAVVMYLVEHSTWFEKINNKSIIIRD